MTFVSPWPIRFHDKTKLECSSQRIPRAVVLGLLELNCDWLKIPTSEKSFLVRVRRRYFSAETSDSRKYVCVRRLVVRGNSNAAAFSFSSKTQIIRHILQVSQGLLSTIHKKCQASQSVLLLFNLKMNVERSKCRCLLTLTFLV